MTREERENSLHCLKVMVEEANCEDCKLYGTTGTDHCERDCVRNAIEALEQEPFINKPCVSSGVCEHDKNKVLDKIRAEIEELTKCPYGTECLGANCPSNTDCMLCGDHVLEIIDKYRTESEG